jgi:Helicase conserved C-terminal domain
VAGKAPTGESAPSDDVVIRLTEEEAQANALAVLQLCLAGRLRCSEKTRRPSAATVEVVAGALAAGDFYLLHAIAAFAWPLLVQAGGLAELAGGRLQLTSRGRTALAKPAAETIRHLWRRWLSHGVIDEMSRIEEIKGQLSANVLTAAGPRRRAVAEALATCPPGEWVAVEELFATMRRTGLSPTVARGERSLWKLYIAHPEYGSLGYAGYHDWPVLEGRYTLCVLFEYAATLGLIDISYTDPDGARSDYHENWGIDDLEYLSRYDGLEALRLNALGAYAFGLADRYQPSRPTAEPGRALKVLPNLDVVLTGELAPAGRLLLDAYAQRISDRVWSMSPATLLAAVGQGRDLAEFTTFLESHSANEIPATVTALFGDVARRVGQLRDAGTARVIECADRAVALLIARDRQAGPLCRLLGDRHLAIPLEHEAAFRRRLRKMGYVLPIASATSRRRGRGTK